ncbi:MAG: glutaryl-CoA dehydrogenase [Bacteroidia bacterium]|jgi:glutaryl-CoA dehydrogenase
MALDPYKALDYFNLDDQFSEEELMIRDAVRTWTSERFVPIIGEHFEAGTFPMELVPELGELGVFGCTFPEKYGCAGLSSTTYGLICQELERGDSGLRSFVSVQGSLVMYPIFTFGTEEQRMEWLPKLASGEAVGCFGLTEPDHGSDPGGMTTRAVKDGDDWILNGRKMWITNGTISDVAIVWAQTEDGIRGFCVPTNLPGFSAPEQKHKFSLRASVTSELVMEDVRLPGSALMPGTGGLKSPLMCLTQARYGIAWGTVGAAMACFDEGLRYAQDRVVFGTPLAAKQLAQKKLADIASDISLAQLMNLRLGRMKDAGTMKPHHVSMAKRNGCELGLNSARVIRDLLGANGISLEFQTGRHMCNLESVITYEGTHDIHTLAIGMALTGHSAFR